MRLAGIEPSSVSILLDELRDEIVWLNEAG
jgi:hypothetical protein